MYEPFVVGGEPARARLRAGLSELRGECVALRGLVPSPQGWRGLASAAFGLRVGALHARIEIVLGAVAAAEAVL